jgi:hypothetical protein
VDPSTEQHAQRTEAEAEVEAQQRQQQAALRILNTIFRCANGKDRRRSLLNARELEALDADAQGCSFTGPEAAELELACARKAEVGRSARLCVQQKIHTAKSASEHGASSYQHGDDFGRAVPLQFAHQELGGGGPIIPCSPTSRRRASNAVNLAKILLANRVGVHAATQGAVETAVAAGVTATVQAYRPASAAAAVVTAMESRRRLRYVGARMALAM